MLAHSHRARVWCDIADEMPLRIAVERERQLSFNFSVLWKCLRVIERDGGSVRIHLVASLLHPRQRLSNLVDVALEEVRGIDQNSSVRILGFHFEPAEDRLRKRLLYRKALGGISGARTKFGVRFNEQKLWSSAFEVNDAAL